MSYVLFGTELRRRGASGADPSLAAERLPAEISMTVLHAQLEPILLAIATDPAGAALRELRPRPEDYAKVFVGETERLAREWYDKLWDAGIGFRRPVRRTQIAIDLALAGAFIDDNAMSRSFPADTGRW